MSLVDLVDNAGRRTSPTSEQSQPVISQTAIKYSTDTAGTDYSTAVTAGKRYRFTSHLVGGFVFGLATVASGSEANIRWCCPLYQSIEIDIPSGYALLYRTPDTTNAVGFLVEIES